MNMKKLLLTVLAVLAVSGFYGCSKAESTADDELQEDSLSFEEYLKEDCKMLKKEIAEVELRLKENESKASKISENFMEGDATSDNYYSVSHLLYNYKVNSIGLYFFQNDSGQLRNLRLDIRYKGERFRDYENDVCFNIDGEYVGFTPNEFDVKRNNTIDESIWLCNAPASYCVPLLERISKAHDVKIYFYPEYMWPDSLELSHNQLVAFKETLEYYNLLKEIVTDKKYVEHLKYSLDMDEKQLRGEELVSPILIDDI